MRVALWGRRRVQCSECASRGGVQWRGAGSDGAHAEGASTLLRLLDAPPARLALPAPTEPAQQQEEPRLPPTPPLEQVPINQAGDTIPLAHNLPRRACRGAA